MRKSLPEDNFFTKALVTMTLDNACKAVTVGNPPS